MTVDKYALLDSIHNLSRQAYLAESAMPGRFAAKPARQFAIESWEAVIADCELGMPLDQEFFSDKKAYAEEQIARLKAKP